MGSSSQTESPTRVNSSRKITTSKALVNEPPVQSFNQRFNNAGQKDATRLAVSCWITNVCGRGSLPDGESNPKWALYVSWRLGAQLVESSLKITDQDQ